MIPLKSKTERMNNSLELFYCQAPSQARRFLSFLLNSFLYAKSMQVSGGSIQEAQNSDFTWKNIYITQTPAN